MNNLSLLACGINHKTAPVYVREKLAFTADTMPTSLIELVGQTSFKEAVILSTCNRTEFYCAGDNINSLLEWLQQRQSLAPEQLHSSLYVHHNQAAVKHILRVASGLDSMVLGEPQILGQVKTAYLFAHAAGTLGKCLRHLFDYVFSTTKQVRAQTAVGMHPVSIAYAAVNLAKHIFADLSQNTVLLIGAGETIALTARHLCSTGITNIYVANRTLARAEKLATQVNAQAITLDAIPHYLAKTDIVISATASPLPILGKGMIESALKQRKHRPIFMVDLAVPRDIEPEVSKLTDVYLYTVDDLQNIILQNLTHRQNAAIEAETIINEKAIDYMHRLKVLEATPIIRACRDKANNIREQELAKALRLIQQGLTPAQALERLAYNLTNKILHVPSVKMREAAYLDQFELLQYARQLFDI